MLHKNLPDSTRGRKLFIRRLLDTVAWAKYCVSLDFKNAGAVLNAHRDFSRMRKAYTIHPEIDLLDTRQDTHRDILIDFYLKQHKTYK